MTGNAPVLFTSNSTSLTTVDVPTWATCVDLVALGGGGGGQGGGIVSVGHGGYGGRWSYTTVDLREWLAGHGDVVSVHADLRVGPGGAGGNGATFGAGSPGKPGSQSTVRLYAKTASGQTIEYGHFFGAGGADPAGSSGSQTGGGAGMMIGQNAVGGNLNGGKDLELDDVIYVGGQGAGPNTQSQGINKPGGGGSGGGAGMGAGGVGGIGFAAVRCYDPPPHLKINIYECVGTGSDLELTPVKQGIDARYFSHTTITGYPNNVLVGPSSAQGIQRVIEAINANPGRFVLVGLSQGALIMSEVYKKLVSGEVNRLPDCLGIFLLGNPEREEGRSFPGCVPPSGHGIVGPNRRLTNTTDLVWELAAEGDPICCNGDDASGQALTQIFELLMGQTSSLIPLGTGVTAIVDLLTGMNANHNVYFKDDWFPIQGDRRSGLQIILDQLNKTVGPQHWLDYPLEA